MHLLTHSPAISTSRLAKAKAALAAAETAIAHLNLACAALSVSERSTFGLALRYSLTEVLSDRIPFGGGTISMSDLSRRAGAAAAIGRVTVTDEELAAAAKANGVPAARIAAAYPRATGGAEAFAGQAKARPRAKAKPVFKTLSLEDLL